MASRILLISANRCTAPDPVFPLGLAHLSAALRRAGHEVAWLDVLIGLERLGEVLSTVAAVYRHFAAQYRRRAHPQAGDVC